MKLYILRHTEAHPGSPDETRELTSKGLRQARQLGAFFKGRETFQLAEIRHSGLVRARQTAEEFAAALGFEGAAAADERLRPGEPAGALAAWLEKQPIKKKKTGLMLTGHNPQLSRLAAVLTGGREEDERFILKKGALICLEPAARPSWAVKWMVTPKLLFQFRGCQTARFH